MVSYVKLFFKGVNFMFNSMPLPEELNNDTIRELLRIIREKNQPINTTDLAESVKISWPTADKYLRKLKQHNILTDENGVCKTTLNADFCYCAGVFVVGKKISMSVVDFQGEEVEYFSENIDQDGFVVVIERILKKSKFNITALRITSYPYETTKMNGIDFHLFNADCTTTNTFLQKAFHNINVEVLETNTANAITCYRLDLNSTARAGEVKVLGITQDEVAITTILKGEISKTSIIFLSNMKSMFFNEVLKPIISISRPDKIAFYPIDNEAKCWIKENILIWSEEMIKKSMSVSNNRKVISLNVPDMFVNEMKPSYVIALSCL